MELARPYRLVAAFTGLYVLIFSAYYLGRKNFEFIAYVVVLVFFFWLLLATIQHTKLTTGLLWGLSVWGLLHMAGGSILVDGDVLYALHLVPLYDGGGEYFILKYDQAIHFYGFMITTLVMLHLLHIRFRTSVSRKFLYFTAIFAGLGLSALNEIIEFLAVLLIPETGVGGYYNTGLDLVFNFLGCLFACVMDYWK